MTSVVFVPTAPYVNATGSMTVLATGSASGAGALTPDFTGAAVPGFRGFKTAALTGALGFLGLVFAES
ncbi:hypothetical protein EJ02DRAFT_449490 [Clathrospora elynae]|uniref:Uncharacterized protein n=1 Tax=Clathrospora elynae TaxID=706981 RepID=A0A6A5T5X7_9PLEO|nr:hypothetical protein EJ02DRAFT_449490 [Clathrospora elynae]